MNPLPFFRFKDLNSSIAFLCFFGFGLKANDKAKAPIVISDVFRISEIAIYQTMENLNSERSEKVTSLCAIYNNLFYFIHDNNLGDHKDFPLHLCHILESYLLDHRAAVHSRQVDNNVFALTTLGSLKALIEESEKIGSEKLPDALQAFLKGGPYPLPKKE